MKPNNPFLVTGYHSPEYFCDRRQETETMIQALYNGRNVTLIAPRRMGKTGLVKNVFYKLREQEPDIVTFYMDIYSTQSLGDFIRLFAGTVLGKLDSVPQKALARVGKFIKSCRPGIYVRRADRTAESHHRHCSFIRGSHSQGDIRLSAIV